MSLPSNKLKKNKIPILIRAESGYNSGNDSGKTPASFQGWPGFGHGIVIRVKRVKIKVCPPKKKKKKKKNEQVPYAYG